MGIRQVNAKQVSYIQKENNNKHKQKRKIETPFHRAYKYYHRKTVTSIRVPRNHEVNEYTNNSTPC